MAAAYRLPSAAHACAPSVACVRARLPTAHRMRSCTAQVLDHISRHERIRGPFIVVAPLSTLQHWQREVESWTGLNCVQYHGSAESRALIQQCARCATALVPRLRPSRAPVCAWGLREKGGKRRAQAEEGAFLLSLRL